MKMQTGVRRELELPLASRIPSREGTTLRDSRHHGRSVCIYPDFRAQLPDLASSGSNPERPCIRHYVYLRMDCFGADGRAGTLPKGYSAEIPHQHHVAAAMIHLHVVQPAAVR